MPAVFARPDLPRAGHPRLRLASRRLAGDFERWPCDRSGFDDWGVRRARSSGTSTSSDMGTTVASTRASGSSTATAMRRRRRRGCPAQASRDCERHRERPACVPPVVPAEPCSRPASGHDSRPASRRVSRRCPAYSRASLARAQHAVVAGQLALDAQASRHPPHPGVRPVERAHDCRQHLREAIAPRDVRQLVQEHRPASIERPGVGDRGNQDGAVAARRWPSASTARGFAADAPAG